MVYRNNKKIDPAEEDDGSKSTLIPKSLLPEGVKVGDEVRLKISHSFDDEFEVEYSHKEKSKDESSEEQKEEPSADMEQADSDLDALATPVE